MDMEFLLNRIPALVSMVNTLGYLAGRESMFSDIRPEGVIEYQAKIIATSKGFEDRLAQVLQFVRQK